MATTGETATAEDPTEAGGGGGASPTVDPRAPRFGQSLTAIGFGAGIALDLPAVVYAVTIVLVAAVASGWRLDLYAVLWRRLLVPIVGYPGEREAAAPHRFARLMGAGFGLLGSGLVLAGYSLAGYATVGVVVVLAGLAATTGVCLGCRMYRQVRFVRGLGLL
ncbi:MAG: DUF4395 domain-containing protein [Haloarculaceae archaeon]